MSSKQVCNQKRRLEKGLKTVELDRETLQQIDSIYSLLAGLPNASPRRKIIDIINFVLNNVTTAEVEDPMVIEVDPTDEASKTACGHGKTCLKSLVDLKTRSQVISRLESIFEEVDVHLKSKFKCTLTEALTVLYKTTPKKFDTIVDSATGGQVREDLVKAERFKIIEEMKIPKERALLAKDESLMSDSVFKNFVTDGGLASFYPSLDEL